MDSIKIKEKERELRGMSIEEQLEGYFRKLVDAEVAVDTQLIESGLIDSMGIQELIGFIESAYNLEFEMDDLTVDNFGTINDIKKLILLKRGEA